MRKPTRNIRKIMRKITRNHTYNLMMSLATIMTCLKDLTLQRKSWVKKIKSRGNKKEDLRLLEKRSRKNIKI